jgi:transposase
LSFGISHEQMCGYSATCISCKDAKELPTDNSIRTWYKQFTETGCLCKQKSSGRPLTAEDDVERVRATRGAHI